MQAYLVKSEEELQAFAAQLATYLTPGMVLLLDGELGAGKTSFTKGLAKGLGITSVIKSPTYTFVREYESGRLPLYHMDVYRLEEIGSDGLGFEEYFERGGVTVIEWSQFIQDILPADVFIIHIERIEGASTQRQISLEARGEIYEALKVSFDNGWVS